MRLMFGGGIADWTFSADSDGSALLAGGAQLTFWNAESGGTQYTDLRTLDGAALAVVTTSTGSDGRSTGQIPPFLGPDGVFQMWASANGGPRAIMAATNLGDFFGDAVNRLNAHLDPAVSNPHRTGIGNLVGVDMSGAAEGKILGITASGLVVPLTVPGVSGTVTQAGDQTITGTKTFANPSPAALKAVFAAAAGQTADLLRVLNGAGVATVWADAEGMLRARAAAPDDVALEVAAAVGQTAAPFRVVNSAGVTLFSVTPGGAITAANLGRTLSFSKAGTPATGGSSAFRLYNDTGVALVIRSVRANLGTAASSGSTRVDLNLNGASMFASTSAQPTIPAGQNTSGAVTGLSTTTWPAGAYINVDVDSVGTGASDLTVQIEAG